MICSEISLSAAHYLFIYLFFNIPLCPDPSQHMCIIEASLSPSKTLSQLHTESSNLIDYSLVEDSVASHSRSIVE